MNCLRNIVIFNNGIRNPLSTDSLEDVLLALRILSPEKEDELAVSHEQRSVMTVLLCKR